LAGTSGLIHPIYSQFYYKNLQFLDNYKNVEFKRNYFYLKTSISRKNPNTVRTRQRQKICREIKRNYIKFAQLKMFEQNKKDTVLIEKQQLLNENH